MLEVSAMAAQNVEGLKLGQSILSQDGNYIYHVSIIDFLQKYTFKKKMERLLKIAFFSAPPAELSSISVPLYRARFINFMKEKVFNYEFNHKLAT